MGAPMDGQPWITLRSDDLTAQIDPHGAQLSTLRDRGGLDLLWTGDPAVWAGRAPLLFPIVGVLVGGTYRLGARTFQLPRHGFARGKVFSVEESTSSSALLRLRADAASSQVYPFTFELEVAFELTGPQLSVTTTIRNQGLESMPASVGYHPGFRWPLPFGQSRASHGLSFETDEPGPIRRIDAAGLLRPERLPTPIVQRRLALTDSLFQDDVIIFDEIKSRSVVYGSAAGPSIEVGFPDAPYLGVWSKPGAQFVCIEPWHGVTDPVGFVGDFTEKPGVFRVAPSASFATTMTIALRNNTLS